MSTHVIRNLGSLAVAALLVGCFDEQREPLPVAPPSTLEATIYTISGQVLGPDGSTICDFVPDGATVFLRVIDPATATPGAPFAGGQNLTCPVNSFAIAVAPGTYRLRVEMPDDPSIGALPFRHLEPGEVVVGGMDVVKDVQVLNGEPMGGSMTIDGTPLAGGLMTLIYDLPTNVRFGAAFGITGPDGEWDDRNPDRSPMRVQNNAGSVPYRASLDDCPTLGTRVLSSDIPSGSFFFPTQVSAIDCAMETGPATDFSHSLTRLVVTPLPGDIGGQSPELFDEYGRGWGVQFPIGPSEAPVYHPLGASHLWLGGLLVGVVPDNVVLSGIDVGGLFQCGGACRDLGLDGAVRMDVTGSGKKVTWSYSDAPSPEGVGLSVVQRSLDGKPPYDYVMFDYTFENTGPSTITFYAGFFGDWDVGPNAANDIGFTALDGQLMYQTNVGEIGAHVGTLLNSDYPISGNFFFNNITNPARL
ncbi:MAG: hypothetical protein JSU87_09180, partial [Gemmatimonadota bacterium]